MGSAASGRSGVRLTDSIKLKRADQHEIKRRLRELKDVPHEAITEEMPAAYWAGLFDAEGCVKFHRHYKTFLLARDW